MSWPNLVPKRLCKTPILVHLYREELNEDGAPAGAAGVELNEDGEPVYPLEEMETTCNWQDSARIVRTDQEHSVQLTGVALFPGDLCPELAVISGGTVTVFGEQRTIVRGSKCRNPDGTVNYTRLEVV